MKRILYCTILALLAGFSLGAQNVSDMIISEVLVGNEDSVLDDFGRHTDWIEVFNTSMGTVNIAGCFFTDDLSDLTKSSVIKGDNRTKIGPQQSAVFYASGNSHEGTFYLNFKLRKGSTLYLVSNDGRTIVDSIEIPADYPAGKSISKFHTDPEDIRTPWTDVKASAPTPMSMNGATNQKSKAQALKETDPYGFTLSLTAVSVVFSALIILFIIYNISGKAFSGVYKQRREERRKRKAAKAAALAAPAAAGMTPEVAAAIAMALDQANGNETYAAIALALDLYLGGGIHDAEPFVLTFAPKGSDWNNKNLNFRKIPKK